MDEAAVLDAPVTDVSTPEPVESAPVDTGIEPESTQEGESQTEEQEVRPQRPTFTDDGKLDPKVKAGLDQLHKLDPNAARDIRNDLMRYNALRQEFPGGVQEAKQIKQLVEDVGGQEGIQKLQEGNQQFDTLAKQFMDGDPAFLKDLIESSEDAFLKMVPDAYVKFSQMNPAGFSSMVCSTTLDFMRTMEVPLYLKMLKTFVPQDNVQAHEALAGLEGYVSQVKKLSEQPVYTPKQKVAPDTRETEIQQREINLRKQEMGTQSRTLHNSLYTRTLEELTKGKTLTEEKRGAITELYKANLQRAMNNSPKFKEKMQAYLDADDRKGYMRFMESFYGSNLKKALEQALAHVSLDGAKPQTPKPAAQARAAAQPKPQAGHQWRSKKPDNSEFDMARMDMSMAKKGFGILKNGTKVQWDPNRL